MSFMEKVSNFFGLEDEEYTDNYQATQNKPVRPQQSSAASVSKQAPKQQKKSQPKTSNAGPAVRKPVQPKAQAKKQAPQNSRPVGKAAATEQRQPQPAATNRAENNVVSMKTNANQPRQTPKSQSGKIMVIEPRAYSEAMTIAKHVIGGKSVLVNFRLIEEHQARRIVDFLTGTVYAEDGDIKRVADEIFLCTPKEVEIDGTAQSLVESNLLDL